MNDDAVPPNVIKLDIPERLELTLFIQKLLRSRRKAEALKWLSASCAERRRAIGLFRGPKSSIKLVKELYATGATKVNLVDIKTDSKGNQHSDKIVVVLPEDEILRAKIFQWCEQQGEKLGHLPDADGGESHMYLYIG